MSFLLGQQKQPKIAEQDITVYKLMSFSDNKLFSPLYPKFGFSLDKRYTAQAPDGQLISSLQVAVDGTIHEGFHSHTSLNHLKEIDDYRYHIVRCIVPKGTWYCINTDLQKCVASSIIFKEIL